MIFKLISESNYNEQANTNIVNIGSDTNIVSVSVQPLEVVQCVIHLYLSGDAAV